MSNRERSLKALMRLCPALEEFDLRFKNFPSDSRLCGVAIIEIDVLFDFNF